MSLDVRPYPPTESEQSITLSHTLADGVLVELVYAPDQATVAPADWQKWLQNFALPAGGWPVWAAQVADGFYDAVLPLVLELSVTTSSENCYVNRAQPHLVEDEEEF